MKIRSATVSDADQMSSVLKEIIATNGKQRPHDPSFVIANYISNPHRVRCSVAVVDGELLGFQSLIKAVEGNRYGTPEGWGIIGTHISPRAARRGIGKALFLASRQAAKEAGLVKIDAFIGEDNEPALNYYEAMGFRAYKHGDGAVSKAFDLAEG